ncbi:hypothetical protein O9929_21645 [Vibrio lentus]|nr:hypothetical protein [Vibrio lentus]
MISAQRVPIQCKEPVQTSAWDQITGEQAQLLEHWQTLGQFRQRHPAIAQEVNTSFVTARATMRSNDNTKMTRYWSFMPAQSKR